MMEEYLHEIGFEPDDINFILSQNLKYAEVIEPIVKEYILNLGTEPFVQYQGNERALSLRKAELFVKQAHERIADGNKFVLNLLLWLNCIPYLHKEYKKLRISDEIFYDSMKDFLYKVKECKSIYGICGVFVNWFFLFFELKELSLGRLQYEVYQFDYEEYVFSDVKIKKGDRVYFSHIPSSGALTYDMCMDSFQKAYEFFKSDLSGDIIPIISHTWLLYRPYIDSVFPENSNLWKFAKMFDIIDTTSTGNVFDDSWRIFNKKYEGTTTDLPTDNTLRRNFVEYIKSGGDFGYGYGIILYDGKQKKIVNI